MLMQRQHLKGQQDLAVSDSVYRCARCEAVGTEGCCPNSVIQDVVMRWKFQNSHYKGILDCLEDIRVHLNVFRRDEVKKKVQQFTEELQSSKEVTVGRSGPKPLPPLKSTQTPETDRRSSSKSFTDVAGSPHFEETDLAESVVALGNRRKTLMASLRAD